MKSWRKHHKHYRDYWRWQLELQKFADHTLFFILAHGQKEKVRFRWKCDAPLKRAILLVRAARDRRGGDHDAGEKPH